jgi:hypothetical protein
MVKKTESRTWDKVSTYVKAQKPNHQRIIQKLRRLVREAAPSLREKLKWGNPCYIQGENQNVCSIYVISNHVNLGFFHGINLQDPKKRLEGTGKAMRHIKTRNAEDIEATVITKLVQQAAARQTRRTSKKSE